MDGDDRVCPILTDLTSDTLTCERVRTYYETAVIRSEVIDKGREEIPKNRYTTQ